MPAVLFITRVFNGRRAQRKGNSMNNTTTHLTQLRELHQRIVNQPGHSPSIRWELWGRIRTAEQVLAEDRAESPGTPDRTLAARRRAFHRRFGSVGGFIAGGMVLLSLAAWFARDVIPAEIWVIFTWMALTAAHNVPLLAAA